MIRIVALVLAALCPMACMTVNPNLSHGKKMSLSGESLVLAKTNPGKLCFDGIVQGSVHVRSTYLADKAGSISYTEGMDYTVNYAEGTIARTAQSRIPDYATHPLYGKTDFDHGKVPNCTNHPFFVWVDYKTTHGRAFAQPNDQGKFLTATRKKLSQGGPFKIATYGDSITAGGEASEPNLRFQARFGQYLQGKFPKSTIAIEDVSIPGYCSKHGILWFDKYIGKVDKPDLVLVGFGMNDHNIRSEEPAQFKENLVALVRQIRERKGAEVILFSAFPPNDNWHYGTHRMAQYAAATQQAAQEAQCAYADVYHVWEMVLQRKDQSSLLGNNINHPNDFGHWLYEQAFEALRF